MTSTSRSKVCDACGAPAFVKVSKGSACEVCIVAVCRSAAADWRQWFDAPQPGSFNGLATVADAEVHAHLAREFEEMDTDLAAAEATLAILVAPALAEQIGDLVLEGLSDVGWRRFRVREWSFGPA